MPKRIDEIEIMRIFGAVGVIMIHITSVFTLLSEITLVGALYLYLDWFSLFAVPLFIFVSGFGLIYSKTDDSNTAVFYKRRFAKLLPPYLFFSVLSMSLFYIVKGEVYPPLHYVYLLLSGKSFSHLWFFSILFQFYILFPQIKRVYGIFKNKRVFVLCTLILQISWQLFKNSFGPIDFPVFLSHIFYFGLGFFAAEKFSEIKSSVLKTPTYLLLGLALFLTLVISQPMYSALVNGYSFYEIPPQFNYPGIFLQPVTYVIIIALTYKVSHRIKSSASRDLFLNISKATFGIYLIHMYVLYALDKLVVRAGINHDSILYLLILLPVVFLISYAATLITNKTPLSEIITGTGKGSLFCFRR